MFILYTRLVLQDYYRKRKANTLSSGLERPTPAKIKAACLAVCTARHQKKDEKALMDFFEEEVSDQMNALRLIKKSAPDDFKPLVKYMRGETSSTLDKNVELLAWLIDFEQRPYKLEERYDPVDIDEITDEVYMAAAIGLPKPESREREEKISPEKTTTKNRILLLSILALVVVGLTIYLLWSGKSSQEPIGDQRCMYWVDDHYEPISCNKKVQNTQVIAIDTEILYHFKKITKPDTITLRAAGSLWYARYRGNYEFYTDSGFHPLDPNLRLRPVSENIIRRHAPANP